MGGVLQTSSSYYVDEEKVGSAAGENFNLHYQKQMQMPAHGNKKHFKTKKYVVDY
jgi:hypothetical protein